MIIWNTGVPVAAGITKGSKVKEDADNSKQVLVKVDDSKGGFFLDFGFYNHKAKRWFLQHSNGDWKILSWSEIN